jgi:DNA-binding CsgD family transcriptional regulator
MAKAGAQRRSVSGSRAVPGKVPRGSFHPPPTALSPIARLILDRLDRGVILLDAGRRVLDANEMALRLLEHANGMKLQGGRLLFNDRVFDERVARLLAQPRNGGRHTNRSIAAWIRHDRAPPYRLIVSTLPVGPDERRAALVVLIFGPLERREISADVLKQIYGLTRAQTDVARSLFAGLTVEQTAAELELSLNTIRTHLKHIFTKCDVQSQGELLQLLASGPREL